MKPFYAYYVRLCFYVLAACLPSLPSTGHYADLTVKLPPRAAAGTPILVAGCCFFLHSGYWYCRLTTVLK